MWAWRSRLEVQCKIVHIATFPGGWAAGATYGWGGRHWILLMRTEWFHSHRVYSDGVDH